MTSVVGLETLSRHLTPRNHPSENIFGVFQSDKALCVVRYLRQYVERMEVLGGTDARLFIGVYLPHKAVGWGTVRESWD